jgi:hypothetical protein
MVVPTSLQLTEKNLVPRIPQDGLLIPSICDSNPIPMDRNAARIVPVNF